MAGSMQTGNDLVAISSPLPPVSSSILAASPSDQASLLKSPTLAKSESHLTSIASAGLRTSSSLGMEGNKSSALSPHSAGETAAAPPEKERDAQLVQETLGDGAGQSADKPQDASGTLPDPMDSMTQSIPVTSEEMHVDPQSSPGRDAFGGAGDAAGQSGTLMNTSTVASPGPIEETGSPEGDRSRQQPDHQLHPEPAEETASKAFSYPMPTAGPNDPRRGLSLPHSGFQNNPRSPSAKKHRCPFCSTEFTRHHNLKSHLLTHSQEKPYVCQTCGSRFRRLHDLKRHTKLHTGERPHICPKCGRRFARGDALARHNKGQGGCAGRRASMGSYAGEEEYGETGGGGSGGGEDAMEGLMYTEPERMNEEEERRLNMPSIRKHSAPATATEPSQRQGSVPYQRGPSTYPPIAVTRPSAPGGLFPPAPSHGGSSSSTSPISQSGNAPFPSPTSYPPPNRTESPKPVSPSGLVSNQLGHDNNNSSSNNNNNNSSNANPSHPHSPNPSSQYQASHYNRPPPPASIGLPPPQLGAPQLPPPPGLTPPDSRYTLHSQAPVSPNLPGKPSGSQNHANSHSASGGESGQPQFSSDAANAQGEQSREDKLWAYIRSVHEELSVLRTEVVALRAQIAASQNTSSSTTQSSTVENNSNQASTTAASR
ncbi:hypothetical protein VTN31DRAFT_511 [Thermomyces dupontii]|uniref:uncharacterized protein n=1 Tax=Talaromyces thermophilus TaxID=28565 RepID=UPI00374462EF